MCEIPKGESHFETQLLIENPIDEERGERKTTCSTAAITCLYIPAGFCLWSWPSLLNVALGLATASAGAINTAHWIGLVITTVLLVLTLLTLFYNARTRSKNWGPFMLCLFATPLLMANPILNILFDRDPLKDSPTLDTVVNVNTWLGTFQMITATVWNAGYHRRVIDWCNRRRARHSVQ